METVIKKLEFKPLDENMRLELQKRGIAGIKEKDVSLGDLAGVHISDDDTVRVLRAKMTKSRGKLFGSVAIRRVAPPNGEQPETSCVHKTLNDRSSPVKIILYHHAEPAVGVVETMIPILSHLKRTFKNKEMHISVSRKSSVHMTGYHIAQAFEDMALEIRDDEEQMPGSWIWILPKHIDPQSMFEKISKAHAARVQEALRRRAGAR